MAEPHVLDTSALFCLIEDEPGAQEVAAVLRSGSASACFLSLMEVFYITCQRRGTEAAERRHQQIKALPIEIVESDDALGLSAGRIKASHRLSLADAWIAATAERLDAVLVHKDPEFDALSKRLRMLRLPSKPPKG